MKISAHVSHQFNAFLSSRPAKWVMHAGAHRQRWASRSPYACSQDSRQHGRTRIIAVGILRRGPRCLRLLFRVAGVAGMAGCAGCGGFGGARLPPWLPPWLGAGARVKGRGQSCKPRKPAQDHVPTLSWDTHAHLRGRGAEGRAPDGISLTSTPPATLWHLAGQRCQSPR
jgi:hypothetical protein